MQVWPFCLKKKKKKSFQNSVLLFMNSGGESFVFWGLFFERTGEIWFFDFNLFCINLHKITSDCGIKQTFFSQ